MGSRFDAAHAFTAKWEGGYVEHPADPGGATKYGVSLRWLRALHADMDGDGDVDADDVRSLSKQQATRLFRQHFWDALQCDRLPQAMSTVLYDSAVNMGAPRAVRLLQQSCNTVADANLPDFTTIAEDGVLGPRTRDLAGVLRQHELDYFTARHLLRARSRFYRELTQRRRELQVFLPGWSRRVEALNTYLGEMERGA